MLLEITKKRKSDTLINQIVGQIRILIEKDELPQGAKLPSIRKFTNVYNVSSSTVVEAYGRLADEGMVISKLGSGFYVSKLNKKALSNSYIL